ncbi:hypothetical protein [Nannocystis pusilla]
MDRGLRLAVEPGVVERERGAAGQLLGEREVGGAEAAVDRGGAE